MRRAVAIAAVIVAVVVALFWLRQRRAAAPATSSSPPPFAATAPPRAPPRPAPPLRLPNATVVAAAESAAGTFAGRVLSSTDGKAIARTSLTFLHEGAAVSTESDEGGRFAVRGAPGTYELASATAKGFAPFEAQLGHSPVTVQARAGVRLDDVTIYLSPALELDVLVVDEHSKPVAGAEVRAFDERSGAAEAKAATSDDKGHAKVAAHGWDLVEARHAGYVGAREYVSVAAQTSGRMTLHLVAGAERARMTIGGRVVDGKGLPVDGALVEAFAPPSLEGATVAGAQALSGADGRFALAALDDAVYSVRATTRAQGSAIARDVHAGANDVELKLGAPNAILHGVVRDSTGKPLTAFTVVAWPREGVFGRGPDERATAIDPEGRYALPLSPGTYVVSAAARGFARAPDRVIEIGESGAEADFTLARGSRIFGRVFERDTNKPLARASVSFEGHAIDDGIGLATDAETSADGSFSLDGLPAGRQSLNVQALGHDGRILGGLDVPKDGALGPLAIDLAKTEAGEEPRTELVGIGAMLAARPEGMIVTGLTPNGGASDAGLVVGDIVVSIDGQSVEPIGFVGSIQLIRGPEDSIVTLTVKRKDGSVQTIPVRRKRVNF